MILKEKRKLEELNQFLLTVTEVIIKSGNNFAYDFDLYILAIINRAISLNKAFVLLLDNDNSFTAISILRLQLDNVLRLNAIKVANNKEAFLNHFFEGKPINQYNENKKYFSDKYLATELNKENSGALELYEFLCGFVHFSDKHFEAIKTKSLNKESMFRIVVGNSDVLTEEEKSVYYERITSISNTIVKISKEWIDQKKVMIEQIKRIN